MINFSSSKLWSAWLKLLVFFVSFWRNSHHWVRASSFTSFLDHTKRRITVGRTPLDEWSALRRDLYLTAYNTHDREISMLPVGFEPRISTGERPQTYALDFAATRAGMSWLSFMFPVFLRRTWQRTAEVNLWNSATCFFLHGLCLCMLKHHASITAEP